MSETGTAASATTFSQLWDELKSDAQTAIATVENAAKGLEAGIVPILESEFVAFAAKFKTIASTLLVNLVKAGVTMLKAKSFSITAVLQAAQAAGQSFTSDLYSLAVATVEQVAAALAMALAVPAFAK